MSVSGRTDHIQIARVIGIPIYLHFSWLIIVGLIVWTLSTGYFPAQYPDLPASSISSGKFVFLATEAYLMENGGLGAPVKGATLIGNGPDVMTRVSMVGRDLRLDDGVGTCGKEGQDVPVGVGQPTLRVDGLTVGGTA